MQAIRPFMLVGSQALQVLGQRAGTALASWAAGWSLCGEAPAIVATPVAGSEPERLPCRHFSGEGGRLWVALAAGPSQELARAVLGPSRAAGFGANDDWLAQVLAQARDALCAALVESLLGAAAESDGPAVPDDKLWQPGSGAVRFDCAALGLQAWASADVLRHVPPAEVARRAMAPTTDLQRAAASQAVTLGVVAGRVELELGRLLELQAGDVLRLPSRLDEPLWLVGPGGDTLARCALGEQAGRLAVRLVRPS
ncbi:FliM/FliN family flagellar motor C-terminal domain-containing protein [Aquabacterium sp. A7-Y]|uniref:FliM/FliN family flagellar motor C-terminal domain-containing protein n=1 Tax=Aquabacterium sp. A7-Y TaxID=1349605 RepID=UPI00223E5699|nr:FliM/FliN family flagellar motor C-terminal domain-containing protein [Aquabacterium sp. A7-Y]MCW7540867.1 FliM/FliN family flagellar motor C-terminal domain-containing protein [Aquabacterium sp. A7-Y]